VRINVLGCHGSDQLLPRFQTSLTCGTCGFLFNGTLLLDAGTVGAKLHLDEQHAIRHVLLSHLHFDHIQGLPTLVDNRFGETDGLVVASIPEVLGGLKTHIFNGEVYPNFFHLPTPDRPILTSQALSPGQAYLLSGLSVIPIRVNHLVPAVGFLISDDRSTVLYSGDTHHTEDIWRVARQMPNLKAVLIEASYPDHMADLAIHSKHLTPAMLRKEFEKLEQPELPLYVFHMKPRFRDHIVQELHALNIPNLSVLEEGQEIVV
jgi:ribonuclease BN (tRNA processing enzyme)